MGTRGKQCKGMGLRRLGSCKSSNACRLPWLHALPHSPTALRLLLSQKAARFLHDELLKQGIELLIKPEQYSHAHFFPETYELLQALSPRAVWLKTDGRPESFAEVVEVVKAWGCDYVVLKDYVKSAKAHGERFMQVPVDGDLCEMASEFVAARGSKFNEGR